ncbi:hypothetical protein [Halalkalirubrum salinum]|uniref:hypothetical protein n=1 Tax=Halalkalirubrum salinum TaxID=2563889 RepID=UPI0010FB81C0|nr:hypothetical protein [Halalkalirubrum salinum]
MRLKPTRLPPVPASVDAVLAVRKLVPLVPATTVACQSRLQRRGPAETPEDARDWLALLRSLSVIRSSDSGIVRTRESVTAETIADRFPSAVLSVKTVCGALEREGPLTAAELCEPIVELAPEWERRRSPTWRETWRVACDRLLTWLVLLGHVDRMDDRYALADPDTVGV